jgi:hypothetical protein
MARKKATKANRPEPEQEVSDNPANEPHSPIPSSLTTIAKTPPRPPARGTGLAAAGQSGALQGLPRRAEGDDESVEELVEEGQAHEADFVAGVENAAEPDRREVHTHKLPKDERAD